MTYVFRAYVNGTLRRSADQQLLRGRNVSAYIAGTNVTNGYYWFIIDNLILFITLIVDLRLSMNLISYQTEF